MITINELFSSIGAQVAAFKRLNIPYKVIGISEIDKYAIQSYEAINGPTRNYGDITQIERLDYADLWTYSSPCQDFSTAGKQIRKDYESGLISESRHNMTSMEPRKDGISNTLTSVQKDNYVVEPMAYDEQNGYIRKDGCVGTLTTDGNSPKHNNRVIEPNYSVTLLATDYKNTCCYSNGYRIRKLTPKECWRLMGFTDIEFECAQISGVSNSRLYQQAGNSIVVDVLVAIFKELLK